MKKTLLFALLLILGFSVISNVYAQVNVTIGSGTTTNTTTGPPAPYGTWYKNFRQQFLVLASEIEDAGGGPGNINSVAFNVENLNTCSPMPNYTIRLKHTSQTTLSTTFEAGDYQTVYTQAEFMPVVGWNTHTFTTPFVWDGTSNILVDIYTSIIPGTYTQNASVYYSTTAFNSSLRYQSDSSDASSATTGTTSTNRSNIRFNMNALEVTNPPNPAQIISPADGAVNVMTSATLNWASGGGAPSGYKVHFGTTNPPPFVQNTTENSYAPTLDLTTTYYWKIIPFNAIGDASNCPVWSFTTGGPVVLMSNGTQSVTDGTTYSFYDSGGPDGNYQSSENYTFTFTAANPTSIIHVLFTEFHTENNWDFLKIYNGPDTSAPQIGPANGYTGTTLPAEIIGSNSVTFVFTSDGSVTYSGWAAAVTAANLQHDLGLLSISGNTTPSVGSPSTYTVAVKNNGNNTENTYTVKLMGTGDVELASVPGTAIAPQQTIDVALTWTPSQTGAMQIWGKVELADDAIPTNNQTAPMSLVVQAAGVVAVTIGDGSATARMPMDFLYNNSLSETIYPANEMNIGGLITGVQYYNDFTNANGLMAKPTKIWMGEIADTDLSGGWVPSTSLTSVFDGVVDYPSGQNNINITFTTPYTYAGGNLVVMVQRPMDTNWFSGVNFRTQTIGTARTLNVYSDGTAFDPAAPPAGTNPTGMCPKTTFFLIVDDMGALTGTVRDANNVVMPGATVSITGTPLTTTTDANGVYNFPYVAMGPQTVAATKHGYNVVTHNVTIIEDETVTQDFVLTQLPQVTVTGRIVGSDQPTVGLADAIINLTGYEPYQATTNANGQFTITGVYASQTYEYTAQAVGYQAATGQAVVGTTNLNMGDITVNELAFPPYQVVATEAADYSNVALTWMAPDPTAVGEWIYYDSGENSDSIGLSTGGEFSVAIRFPPSALTDYAGASLHAISLFPGDVGTYSLRVWTGGTAAAPATQVVDQPFTVPTVDVFQTVLLDNPVLISGTEELWFGYNVVHAGGAYPAGCDAGPATNGFGNMIYNSGQWATLTDLAPSLNYNWNIRGYVGYSAPTRAPELTMLAMKSEANGNDRVLGGYKVYRFLAANQDNESSWTNLTTINSATTTNYTDNAWAPLPSGVYKYAVKAVYTNNVLSPAAFSGEIHKGMMGTLTGTVTEFGTNVPIAGATITAGEYSGTSDATGHYSFSVYQGVYTVTCVKVGYQAASQTGVSITGLQTTTQNFVLTEITLPPGGVVAEEVNNNLVNITWMEPGSGADISEGFEGDTFPPTDWTQTITDSGEGPVTGILPTWCQVGTIDLSNPVPPHSGSYQAGLFWDYAHQDEWLMTPQFICPPASSLTFWSYVYLGSTHGDHYYVKVSTDNGSTWTVLWDASALSGGWNYYTTPIVVDLNSYAGQEIKIAWQAIDGDGGGLWYIWCLDDIDVGNPTTTLRFPASALTRVSASGNDHRAPLNVTSNLPASRDMMHSSGLTSAKQAANETTVVRDDRVFLGYRVWRLLQGQESNESAWTQLTTGNISATAWQDTGWGNVPDGWYKWAVKAVYTGDALSLPAFSNAVQKLTQIGTVAGIVRNMANAPIMGATVTCGDVTATTNASGAYSMQVPAGTHNVTASATGYSPSTQTGIIVVTGQTTTVNFQLTESLIIFEDGFETYENFALEFAPWTLVDVDQSGTYGMTGYSWPNVYAPMAYMIFVPSATTPPVTELTAHGGIKMAACFAAVMPSSGGNGPNNDWMITPELTDPGEIKFWARSYISDYGLERFKVGTSTGSTDPNDFTIISGTNYIQAPIEWTEYTYQIPAGATRIGIQCVSSDAFIFLVDDVTVSGGGAVDEPGVPVVATELHGNYPNPFNPETTISFSVKDKGHVKVDIYNVKGQLVKTLVNGNMNAGKHNIVWNGRDNAGNAVSSGVYFYKMNAGKYSSTKKMIMMK
ncbi:MAG TPA: carboxypeptidase regulatory-like domain-containing protein [Candidatus Cloacimonadota bacterium]|nr:carboxypeptidase regulatory-like domain-containing protein [Candidatus Cloacimonadota bacterium]